MNIACKHEFFSEEGKRKGKEKKTLHNEVIVTAANLLADTNACPGTLLEGKKYLEIEYEDL